MCTGIFFKGKDTIVGYNLDIDPKVWNYNIVKNYKVFTVAITIGKTTYYTHGVNNKGKFAALPYMNDSEPYKVSKNHKRIDILVDEFIKDEITFNSALRIAKKGTYNAKFASMHALMVDNDNAILVEPGYETKIIEDDHFVVTNFPLSKEVSDDNPFYGKERYQLVNEELEKATENFSIHDALVLLKKVAQEGQYGTRLSFVYSKNENTVYYVLNNNFEEILKHRFK